MLDDSFDCSPKFVRKFRAESFFLIIIILDGLDKLGPCGFEELDIHLVLRPI